MNLPNKLTMSRLLGVVVISLIYFIFGINTWTMFLILALFLLSSITDFFDGYIARKKNLVTNFGKLMDPLADKLLVIVSIIILIDANVILYSWMLIIIVARELFVLGIRLIALEEGSNVIAASFSGKAKTMTQMVSLTILFLYAALKLIVDNTFITVLWWIGSILFYVSVLLTLISGISIFVKNKKYFKNK